MHIAVGQTHLWLNGDYLTLPFPRYKNGEVPSNKGDRINFNTSAHLKCSMQIKGGLILYGQMCIALPCPNYELISRCQWYGAGRWTLEAVRCWVRKLLYMTSTHAKRQQRTGRGHSKKDFYQSQNMPELWFGLLSFQNLKE